MTFHEFTQEVVPFVTLLTTLIIFFIIRFKNSEITALKTNVSTLESIIKHYDVEQFKKNVDLKIENLILEHKKEIDSVYKRSEENVKNKISELTIPWLVKYNELLDYEFYFLSKLPQEEIEKTLKLLPHNREFIQKQLEDIKSGKLKSTN